MDKSNTARRILRRRSRHPLEMEVRSLADQGHWTRWKLARKRSNIQLGSTAQAALAEPEFARSRDSRNSHKPVNPLQSIVATIGILYVVLKPVHRTVTSVCRSSRGAAGVFLLQSVLIPGNVNSIVITPDVPEPSSCALTVVVLYITMGTRRSKLH